jgi:hypothetical protein
LFIISPVVDVESHWENSAAILALHAPEGKRETAKKSRES